MAKNKWLELSEHPGDSDDKDEISADSNSDEVPDEGESNWYYFDSDGTAAYLNSKAANMSKATTKIGRKFLFLQCLWRPPDRTDPYRHLFRQRFYRIFW